MVKATERRQQTQPKKQMVRLDRGSPYTRVAVTGLTVVMRREPLQHLALSHVVRTEKTQNTSSQVNTTLKLTKPVDLLQLEHGTLADPKM